MGNKHKIKGRHITRAPLHGHKKQSEAAQFDELLRRNTATYVLENHNNNRDLLAGVKVKAEDGSETEMDAKTYIATKTAEQFAKKKRRKSADANLVKWAVEGKNGWLSREERKAATEGAQTQEEALAKLKEAKESKSTSDVWLSEGLRRIGAPLKRPNSPELQKDEDQSSDHQDKKSKEETANEHLKTVSARILKVRDDCLKNTDPAKQQPCTDFGNALENPTKEFNTSITEAEKITDEAAKREAKIAAKEKFAAAESKIVDEAFKAPASKPAATATPLQNAPANPLFPNPGQLPANDDQPIPGIKKPPATPAQTPDPNAAATPAALSEKEQQDALLARQKKLVEDNKSAVNDFQKAATECKMSKEPRCQVLNNAADAEKEYTETHNALKKDKSKTDLQKFQQDMDAEEKYTNAINAAVNSYRNSDATADLSPDEKIKYDQVKKTVTNKAKLSFKSDRKRVDAIELRLVDEVDPQTRQKAKVPERDAEGNLVGTKIKIIPNEDGSCCRSKNIEKGEEFNPVIWRVVNDKGDFITYADPDTLIENIFKDDDDFFTSIEK